MCSAVYLLALPTGNTAWAHGPSNSIASSCGAVSCLINALADGAEGLHF